MIYSNYHNWVDNGRRGVLLRLSNYGSKGYRTIRFTVNTNRKNWQWDFGYSCWGR